MFSLLADIVKMIELKDFIKETLVNIISGVKDANEQVKKEKDANIKRFFLSRDPTKKTYAVTRKGTFVDFDIGLIASEFEGETAKKGIGVALSNILVGTSKKDELKSKDEKIHRIKFKVFVTEDPV